MSLYAGTLESHPKSNAIQKSADVFNKSI
jgi:hypothetical protein